jgi:N-acetylglucosamine kinase-like BadF-type ATPase
MLGDEGSAYWIGREAISAALRARDSVGPANALQALVERACGALLDDIVIKVYADLTDRKLVTRVAHVLGKSPDATARTILENAADHLIAMANSLRARVGGLPVSMVGNVFDIPAVADRFVAATGAGKPIESAEMGAVRLAIGDGNARDAALVT